ncbi:SDR family NAD(P)-dependent oxidoreductase [Stenotrophomonas maltophilia]|nr:SDR family NAD(P)-dependent oxidoreductase [Stenotrophomonas maltophilia]MBA0468556.1 SDR family NAD(P)-dependent oxidoreductase [Stenotrophomonas maltophilia]MBA0475399.1 SDR family NAD(P)-dependent oxidoreductase [Stenotrophomonas maltophilia]MBA0484877.1 SDR family NAD(P)-dependent oxidoreductase [Stenotrophomonas maltophilia]
MSSQYVVVMTGATSGFGSFTLQDLATSPDTRVIVGARGKNRAVPNGVEVLPLNLASLASVRAFAGALIQQLGDKRIDILVLNAGLHGTAADQRSQEGYGLTFAVNHLAHYLLARLLLPHMAEHGRLVITSSNMHNPPIKAIGPKMLDVQEWAHPTKGGSGDGIRSYTASKLCNLMTALYLARHETVLARQIDVIAFNPGLTGGAAGREASALQKAILGIVMHTVFPLLGLFRPEFVMNAPEHSGRMLADVALGTLRLPDERIYVSLVKGQPTFPDPSALARDHEAQERLWRESAALVGLEERSI